MTRWRNLIVLCAIYVSLALATTALHAANSELVLHSFTGSDGEYPSYASLISDSKGNLYGTTYYGGTNGWGVVFELQLLSNGTWAQKVLHDFNNGNGEGYRPEASLIFDQAGNLYGTTTAGGSVGGGTVFELTPNNDGTWAEQILYSFGSQKKQRDGSGPMAGVIFDNSGNLYGTTFYGGTGQCQEFETTVGCGIVFELSPAGNGVWSETILYNFQVSGADGHFPQANLVRDPKGSLYGTTSQGGPSECDGGGCGTVFELSRSQSGHWSETILYNFQPNNDGYGPTNGLVYDHRGNLYGTTPRGGIGCPFAASCGTVFELTKRSNGQWQESILHTFGEGPTDGDFPIGGLAIDAAGDLYGATELGGSGFGTVFKLSPAGAGQWNYTIIYNFPTFPSDGSQPSTGLAFGIGGNLFGTTYYGGDYGDGVIFGVAP